MPTVSTDALTPIVMPGVQTRLTDEEEQELLRVLREANSLAIGATGGVENNAFESAFTRFTGSTDAVALNSCTSALELAAVLAGLSASDEVIMPAHTYVASAVPFARHGVTIRWADINPDTRVVSADTIAPLVSDRTKVVVVVHLYGLPADMDPIMALADKHGFTVVEDCAQAPGALYKDRRVGSIGDFGCFSFQTHKNMQTLGEGGILTLRNAEHGIQARRMRWLGNWSFDEKRDKDWVPAGGNLVEPIPGRWPVNYCLAEPNAAVGRMMLGRLDAINTQRRHQAARFLTGLSDYPELNFQHVPDGCQHAYHLMAARYDGQQYGRQRDDLMSLIREKYQLTCIVQYWPLNRAELFQKFGFASADIPETNRFYDNMISFPWWSDMSDDLIDEMAARTRSALDEMRG
jgi:dTDP-4-amino-4,6-dideoxygalactose transaminase